MAGYLGASPVPQTIQKKETITATAGQTTFNTTGYTDGNFINVFLNGVRLVNGTDYTATNGSDIVLASAASASDVLDFETFNEFQLTDQEFADSVIIENNTSEDSDGGRAGKLVFKGKQSGGEQSTLAEIQASHDGTADDQKADLIFKTNDGSDNAAPTERVRIDSAGVTSVSGSLTLDNSGQSQSLMSVGGGSTNAALNLRGSTGSAYAWQMSTNAHVASALEFTRSSAVGNTTFSTPSMVLDLSGNVGIGTTATASSTSQKNIFLGGTGNIYADAVTSADASLSISQNAKIDADNSWEYIVTDEATNYYQNAGNHVFRRAASGTAGNDITWAEKVRIGEHGLTFNGDTAAANAQSDYEIGDWTPSLGGNATYDIQYGRYAKVGDLVYVRFGIRPTSLGTGSTYIITGLPYTATGETTGLSIGYYDGLGVSHYFIAGYIQNTQIEVLAKTSSTNSVYNNLAVFQNNARLYASAVYRAS